MLSVAIVARTGASNVPKICVPWDEDRALHPTLSSLLLCERRDVEAIAAAAAATQRSIETVCYLVTGPTTRSPRVVVQAVVGSNPIAHLQ